MNISALLAPGQATSAPPSPRVIPSPQVHPATTAEPAPQRGNNTATAKSRRKTPTKPRKSRAKAQRKPEATTGPKPKHKTYLSATQIAERNAYAAFESRVLNLTLDVNDLQQLIRLLEERRDLHVTRLVLTRHQFENDVHLVMERYMRVFGALSRRRTCDELAEFLSRVDPCMLGPGMNAKGGLPLFVWQWGCYNNRFHHWMFNEISTRIVTFIDDDSTVVRDRDNDSFEACGPGGCVVETIGEFTGNPTRAMVAAMFPNLLSDEGYTAALTLQTMHFPTRMIVYFDSRGKIVKHVLEADAFAALHAIVETNTRENTNIAPNERFTELPAQPTAAIEHVDVEMQYSNELSACESSGSEASSTRSRYDVGYLLN